MRYCVIILALLTAIPACADSRFRITVMQQAGLASGKAQCDIRLEIDNEVEITVRRDLVMIHTVSGQDATDDGSDCSAPLADKEMPNFAVQPVDNRSEIKVLQKPSAGNDYAVVVRIVDAASGFGRYHFRLSWDAAPGAGTAVDTPPPPSGRKQNDLEHPPTPPGFVWNNAINYRGRGMGQSLIDGRGPKLADVRVDIDLGGKIVVLFTTEARAGGRGGLRTVAFTGSVMNREGSRIRASMVTEDQRLHGTMVLSVDENHAVNTITMTATDGQDHLRLTWDRK